MSFLNIVPYKDFLLKPAGHKWRLHLQAKTTVFFKTGGYVHIFYQFFHKERKKRNKAANPEEGAAKYDCKKIKPTKRRQKRLTVGGSKSREGKIGEHVQGERSEPEMSRV